MRSTDNLTQIIHALLQLLELSGVEASTMLPMSGISDEILSPQKMERETACPTLAQFGRLYAVIKEHMQDESYGFDGAAQAPVGNRYLVFNLIKLADTLHESLLLLKRQSPLMLGSFSTYNVEQRSGVCRYGFERKSHMAADVNPLLVVNDAVNLYWWWRTCEWLVGEEISLDKIRLMGSASSYSESLTWLFGIEPEYNSEQNVFEFAEEFGRLPIVRPTSELQRISLNPADMMAEIGAQTIMTTSVKVEAIICHRIKEGIPTLAEMAELLHCAPVTLRRQLGKGNTSYQQIKDKCRQDIALRLLSDPTRPLSQVAHAVGFSDTSAFHKAVRKWTGTTPGEWRNANYPNS